MSSTVPERFFQNKNLHEAGQEKEQCQPTLLLLCRDTCKYMPLIKKTLKALGLYVIEQPLVKCIAVLTWGKAGHALVGTGKIVAVGEAEGAGDVPD